MFVVGGFIVLILQFFNLTMMWYGMPELVFLIYILPMITIGLWVHSRIALKKYVVFMSIHKNILKINKILGNQCRNVSL